jgi:hypothetical protein
VLKLQYARDTLFAFMLLARKTFQQLGEHSAGGNYQLCMLIEKVKEFAFARHQAGKELHVWISPVQGHVAESAVLWHIVARDGLNRCRDPTSGEWGYSSGSGVTGQFGGCDAF